MNAAEWIPASAGMTGVLTITRCVTLASFRGDDGSFDDYEVRHAGILAIVIPAKAGIHWPLNAAEWIPAEACPRMLESGAGMTRVFFGLFGRVALAVKVVLPVSSRTGTWSPTSFVASR
jgi:hypothetical protein